MVDKMMNIIPLLNETVKPFKNTPEKGLLEPIVNAGSEAIYYIGQFCKGVVVTVEYLLHPINLILAIHPAVKATCLFLAVIGITAYVFGYRRGMQLTALSCTSYFCITFLYGLAGGL